MVFLLGCETGISNLVCLKQNAVFSPKCILISCPIAVNGITIYPVSCAAKTWETFLNLFPLTSHIKSVSHSCRFCMYCKSVLFLPSLLPLSSSFPLVFLDHVVFPLDYCSNLVAFHSCLLPHHSSSLFTQRWITHSLPWFLENS